MAGGRGYTDPVAVERMRQGNCPECGQPESSHGGWGAWGCLLTDYGVARRLHDFRSHEPPRDVPLP